MSFILDALKKSELERQRQTIPGLMDSGPLARRARFPLWAVALAALLAVNLAVLLVVLLRSPARTGSVPPPRVSAATPAATPAPPAALPTATAAAPAPANTEQHFSPMDAAPVYAPEVPAADDRGEMRAASKAARETGETRAAVASRSVPQRALQQDPVLTSDADKADQEALPTISEIDPAARAPLPDLHLDVHVYAARPADRFVYINNQKYREGAALADGLALERIRRDGVVLNYNGLRFVLPRQQ
jgi:general secretion pathway protein B